MFGLFNQVRLRRINQLGLCLVLALIPKVCSKPGTTPPAVRSTGIQTQASTSPTSKEILLDELTSGSWTKDLGGPGASFAGDRLIYTFAKDGTYTSRLLTDYPVDPISGEWKVTEDDQGQFHLLLSNKLGLYYLLPMECLIGYEKQSDSLLVSGGNIVNTQKLQRVKASSPEQRH